MYSLFSGRRWAILSGVGVFCLSTFGGRLPAAEPEHPPSIGREPSSNESRRAIMDSNGPDPVVDGWMLDHYNAPRSQSTARESRIERSISLPMPYRDGVELPPEIQEVRETMGGSVVNRFPSLRPEVAGAGSGTNAPRENARRQYGDAIRALREAAAQLDSTANRLEQLELYRQADGLRQQAQQLRVDARAMAGVAPAAQAPSQPTPAIWLDGPPAGPPVWNGDSPSPQKQPPPTYSTPRPQLEPVPQPENPTDPPKPQPLMDSPEATPQPDVEVEG